MDAEAAESVPAARSQNIRHLPKHLIKLSKISAKLAKLRHRSRNSRSNSVVKIKSELEQSSPCPSRKTRVSADNILLLFTILSVIFGVTIGIGLRQLPYKLSPRELLQLKFMGELFVRTLKLLVLPLIASTLICSLTALNSKTAGRLGLMTMIYYLATTFVAVITGIVLVTTIKPGAYANVRDVFDNSSIRDDCKGNTPADAVIDLFRSMFPDNLVSATMYTRIENGTETAISFEQYERLLASNNSNLTLIAYPQQQQKNGMNVLGVIMFFIFFGLMVNRMGPEGEPVAKFFAATEGAIMRMIKLVIWFSPVGIMCLIAHEIVQMKSFTEEVEALGMYVLTVVIGLLIHGCVWLPILCFAIGRQHPFRFACGMMQALFTALGTASSAATMPLAIKCLEENNKIPRKVARFMIPLGATINMDGTALYEAVAAIYIAQTVRMELTVGQVIIVSLTATLASIGAAGIPQAGIVTMVMVLTAVGLPARAFVLIIPVDWFLDRVRTAINVWGDCVGTAVVTRLCRRELEDEEAEKLELENLPKIIEKLPRVDPDGDDELPEKLSLHKSRPSASSFILPIDYLERRDSIDSAGRAVLKQVDISTTPCDDSLESIDEEGRNGEEFEVVLRGADHFQVEDFMPNSEIRKENETLGNEKCRILSRSGYISRDIVTQANCAR